MAVINIRVNDEVKKEALNLWSLIISCNEFIFKKMYK